MTEAFRLGEFLKHDLRVEMPKSSPKRRSMLARWESRLGAIQFPAAAVLAVFLRFSKGSGVSPPLHSFEVRGIGLR